MAREGTEERRALTVLWRIENISYWEDEFHGNVIQSKMFETQCLDGSLLALRVLPKGRFQDNRHLQIELFSPPCVDIDYSIDCEWSLLDDVGSTHFTETLKNQHFNNLYKVCLPSGPTYDDVFVTRKSSFLPHDTLTLRCRIWKSRGDFETAEDICARTRINVAEKSFVWRIEAFSSLRLDQEVTTQVKINVLSVFLLCFSLTGASLEDARVNFRITAGQSNSVQLTLKVSILKDEKEMKCVEGKYVLTNTRRLQSFNLPNLVSRIEILERKSDWLYGDDLNLLCKVVVVKGVVDKVIESTYCGPANLKIDIPRHIPSITTNDHRASTKTELNPRNNVSTFQEASTQTTHQSGDAISQCKGNSSAVLLDDLLTLYKDQTLFDFELRSGDVSFPVHKNVLSARSPVFRAMFCGDMLESDSTSQDVPDVDAHTFNRMLTFLYSGAVDDLQWEGAAKLYYAADKYQVLSLKQECSYILRSGLSVSNVSDILELADRHQDQELTSNVHDFLLIHFDEIVLSDEWDKFLLRNSYFAGKTMKEIYKNKLQN